MTRPRDPLWDEHGEKNESGWEQMKCPYCDPKKLFDSLAQWKSHMQREHGGYTQTEVAAGQGSEVAAGQSGSDKANGGAPAAGTTGTTPPKPKKLSARARELNDKFNKAMRLCVQHVTKGITDGQRNDLNNLIGDVTEGVMGVEFDFEERLFSISGKWALIVGLVLLYAMSAMPTLKDQISAIFKKKKNDEEHSELIN